MAERSAGELARILSGASATVAGSLQVARSRLRAPGRELPARPPLGAGGPTGGATGEGDDDDDSAGERSDGGDLLASCVLWRPEWDQAALARLCAEIGQRRLLAVEPVPTLGTRRLIQRMLARRWRQQLGHDFECDVPRLLRRAGFQIFTIDRFAADRLGLHTYAYLEVGPRRVPAVRAVD